MKKKAVLKLLGTIFPTVRFLAWSKTCYKMASETEVDQREFTFSGYSAYSELQKN